MIEPLPGFVRIDLLRGGFVDLDADSVESIKPGRLYVPAVLRTKSGDEFETLLYPNALRSQIADVRNPQAEEVRA